MSPAIKQKIKYLFILHYTQIGEYLYQYQLVEYLVHQKTGHSFGSVKNCDGDVIGNWCQLIWDHLPNDASIRHGAFFVICDIAELYCFGDEE